MKDIAFLLLTLATVFYALSVLLYLHSFILTSAVFAV